MSSTAPEDGFVAVIGMAGRFPGAADVDALWANLCAARESLTPLPELAPPDQPDYVPAYGIIDRAADFDAPFFDYPPQSALVIDPQQRVLLEVAHEALDRAGYGNADRPLTGVFVGGASTRYGERLRALGDGLPFVDDWQISHGNDLDFLSGRLAYKLGLHGPAVSVQTACSTSLVAVHVAVQALLAGDCDIALAGGTTVLATPPRTRHTPGGVLSPDGHCRAFDASAAGTVNASGAGVVVLRPLADALAAGDHIHAVVRGSAVNNDGRDKIGFTAPSLTGQTAAVLAAHSVAGVGADEIGYVEAHGTGTILGDPIEVAALTQAFRRTTDRRGYCRIGSVKTNIGHTDAAAGVTGLIKAVLAVEHGVLPASLHFREPNPVIDFADSPFQVNAATVPWPESGGRPRIAAVNSLGIGGTNAHAVVAEPPRREPTASSRSHVLLPVSAKTASAADAAVGRLAGFLTEHPAVAPADVSWTLRAGRTHHAHRRFVVARRTGEAAAASSAGPVRAGAAHHDDRPVIFLYAGQGGQHVGMAAELYAQEPVFRRRLDEVAELAASPLGADLRHVLFAEGDDAAAASARLADIAVAQPAVFAVQYALTGLLGSWGLTPDAVTGHSLGAYAAACAAGILTLPDAVRLVAERGRLLGSVPAGAMAAVRLPYADVAGLLPPGLSVGAVNGPEQCTVSGPADGVRRFVEEQNRRGVKTQLLRISTAGHSPLTEPILPAYADFLRELPLHKPEIPFLSDTTGDWSEPSAVTSVSYWTEHLRRPVRFDAVLSRLFGAPESMLVDLGPGRALSSLARQHPGRNADQPIVALTPHPTEEAADAATLLTGVGQVWAAGGRIDLRALHDDERRRRVPLPTYPFERTRLLAGEDDGTGTHPAPTPAPPRRAEDAHAPRPTVLEAVLDAFGGALGLPDVEPEDNFFDLGGDSLIATKVAAWARARFAATVSVADIIRSGDAGRLARLIEERVAAGAEEEEARP
ncbi:beta-ketoacyl synthase N-terminal-like domain-containing protein [Streptomyces spectabilis]|uniref:type I polyketide synthase n=1 Tax=Streptomyces spectabilis TaxID=68270 RepID=UPI0033DF0F48